MQMINNNIQLKARFINYNDFQLDFLTKKIT